MKSVANISLSFYRAKSGVNSIPHMNLLSVYYFLFYSLILAAPLVIYGFSIGVISVRFSRVLIILITPLLILRIMGKPSLIYRDKFFVFGVLPYLFYTTISVWFSSVEREAALLRLGGLYEIIILYMIFIAADLNTERFEKFIKYYILSAVIPLGVALWQLINNILQFSQSEFPFSGLILEQKYDYLISNRIFSVGGGEGITRISSTIAEPTIFGCFLCSVLLLTFIFDYQKNVSIIALRLFQLLVFVILVLALSKLAYIELFIGLLFISIMNRKYKLLLIPSLVIIPFVVFITIHFDLQFLFARIFIDTGHYDLLLESLRELKNIDLLVGEGIGSIPLGSWHRFVISRIYESGIIGLMFVCAVSIIPFKILLKKTVDYKSQKIKYICVGVLFALLFGLHVYDYFIHFFPWIVIGAIMSLYNRKVIDDYKSTFARAKKLNPSPLSRQKAC